MQDSLSSSSSFPSSRCEHSLKKKKRGDSVSCLSNYEAYSKREEVSTKVGKFVVAFFSYNYCGLLFFTGAYVKPEKRESEKIKFSHLMPYNF